MFTTSIIPYSRSNHTLDWSNPQAEELAEEEGDGFDEPDAVNADGDQHMGGVDEDAEGEQGVSLSFSSLSRGSVWVVVRL
jgi:hypothetical protein